MGERIENVMDLDLNLGPVAPTAPVIGASGPSSGESVNLDAWIEPPLMSIREALRQRTRQRWRWRHLQIPLGAHALQLTVDSDATSEDPGAAESGVVDGGGRVRTLQTGEGSVAPEVRRTREPSKSCENHLNLGEKGSLDKGEDVEKSNSEGGSFFDCNICLDLAKEPVVTCCGHLFCWPCIYCWLNNYCEANECPVCKGEVTLKNLTPIYGRGDHTREAEDDLGGIDIPTRPSGRRVESLRQTIHRTASAFPMEEMIRRLGARFELTRDFFQLPEGDSTRDPVDRSSSLLNRFLSSRALRREQTPAIPPDHVVDLTQDRPEIMHRRLPPLTYRRGQSHRNSSGLTPAHADRMVQAYLQRSPPRRSQEQQPPSMDDRDSFSSIAAVIHGESQTMDTAVEIDSMVSLSTSSSSRRRSVASRASDVDSGDSRAPRRRRL